MTSVLCCFVVCAVKMTNLQYTHPRNYGKDSRHCRVCHTTRGLIRKYHLDMCRRCFRERATQIGFVKVCCYLDRRFLAPHLVLILNCLLCMMSCVVPVPLNHLLVLTTAQRRGEPHRST